MFTSKLSDEIRQDVDAEAEYFNSLSDAYKVAAWKETYLSRKKGRGHTGEVYELEEDLFEIEDVLWPAGISDEQKKAVRNKAQELRMPCWQLCYKFLDGNHPNNTCPNSPYKKRRRAGRRVRDRWRTKGTPMAKISEEENEANTDDEPKDGGPTDAQVRSWRRKDEPLAIFKPLEVEEIDMNGFTQGPERRFEFLEG
jgi:hypothetical protein